MTGIQDRKRWYVLRMFSKYNQLSLAVTLRPQRGPDCISDSLRDRREKGRTRAREEEGKMETPAMTVFFEPPSD